LHKGGKGKRAFLCKKENATSTLSPQVQQVP